MEIKFLHTETKKKLLQIFFSLNFHTHMYKPQKQKIPKKIVTLYLWFVHSTKSDEEGPLELPEA